ncbi:MAG: tRNA (N6-threonylcarbamoyladenosine(37)-N6)-methyltransferase TrmO [Chthoniobacteraceae bacterium]
MKLTSIGIIHSPHLQATGTPVQPVFASGIEGTLELHPEYAAGLKDLEGFDRIWILYWFDRAAEARLEVTPYLDTRPHGIFATRSPSRPNPLGISSVRVRRIEGSVIHILDVDVLDGTPLLDIKPYVPAFDAFAAERIGWFEKPKNPPLADGRFEAKR